LWVSGGKPTHNDRVCAGCRAATAGGNPFPCRAGDHGAKRFSFAPGLTAATAATPAPWSLRHDPLAADSPARRLRACQQPRRTGSFHHSETSDRGESHDTAAHLRECPLRPVPGRPGRPRVRGALPHRGLARRAATAARWRAGSEGRWVCSACAPVLTCEVEGHQFSPWRLPVLAEGLVAVSAYRYCRRCCELESRPATRNGCGGGEPR
jgi:hypothetical protein